jgi:hypothetical protein
VHEKCSTLNVEGLEEKMKFFKFFSLIKERTKEKLKISLSSARAANNMMMRTWKHKKIDRLSVERASQMYEQPRGDFVPLIKDNCMFLKMSKKN